MFLLLLLAPEENDPEMKQVEGKRYARVLMNFIPRFFHLLRPVNVVENENGVVMCEGKTGVEIIERRLFAVIAVEINVIDFAERLQGAGKRLAEFTGAHFGRKLVMLERVLCERSCFRATFERDEFFERRCGRFIERGNA